mmetsp:Transcript_3835/g.9360  ORF Transcript_3835/g.9360 Transcript_3835/m.9360 type:complete len:324 (-) Transcript_3835:832-1803(-)|eukprot:CAMPEP_0177629010 /NCGR_PEP_ID=MMETSP0447-20121125/436_1 /TAXON_ID=0 /ORGANISM="Stygamoeba regulata, Strain BSH-02190019" /LENGTH=323 /DNA_ID=CAMNT_0019130295 /DNA_START=52 /DNA_END=1023 /DNA_ORIENTATION=+
MSDCSLCHAHLVQVVENEDDKADHSLIHIKEPILTIGRKTTYQCKPGEQFSTLDSKKVPQNISRVHGRIERRGNSYFLTDLGSLNGTFLKSGKIEANVEQEVKHNDRIRFGSQNSHLYYSLRILSEEKGNANACAGGNASPTPTARTSRKREKTPPTALPNATPTKRTRTAAPTPNSSLADGKKDKTVFKEGTDVEAKCCIDVEEKGAWFEAVIKHYYPRKKKYLVWWKGYDSACVEDVPEKFVRLPNRDSWTYGEVHVGDVVNAQHKENGWWYDARVTQVLGPPEKDKTPCLKVRFIDPVLEGREDTVAFDQVFLITGDRHD